MDDDTVIVAIFIVVILIIAMFVVGISCGTNIVQKQAIEHNAAHYDIKTAQFTWNQ